MTTVPRSVRRRGALVVLAAALVIAACSSTVPGAPYGSLDGVSQRPSGLHVRGWAVDPDTAAPATVHVYLRNGYSGGVTAGPPPRSLVDLHVSAHTAAVHRADVAAAYPAIGAARGFEIDLPQLVSGLNEACAYVLDTAGPGENRLLGCAQLNIASGVVYELAADPVPGGVRFSGIALDPRSAASTEVTVEVGDVVVTEKADVPVDLRTFDGGRYASLEGYGAHGYDIVVPLPAGQHEACLRYPPVPGSGTDGAWETCRMVTVPAV